jgi:hypothetical protein
MACLSLTFPYIQKGKVLPLQLTLIPWLYFGGIAPYSESLAQDGDESLMS